MDKIKEYLEYRLKELDFVLGYFEDEDIKGDINAKITLKEIDQVKNLLVLLSVGVRSEQLLTDEQLRATVEERGFKMVNESDGYDG